MLSILISKIFNRKNIGYIIAVIAIIILLTALGVGWHIYNKLDAENSRLRSNQEALIQKFDTSSTQEINFTKAELKQYLENDAKTKKIIDSLNYKINRIAYIQQFESNTFSHGGGVVNRNTYVVNQLNMDSLLQYLKDSLRIRLTKEQLTGMDSLLVQQAPFKTNGCLEGTVSWIGIYPDSVYVDAVQVQDLTFIGNRKLNKGWFWRDVKRFFTFRWKQIGTDKWETFIDVVNHCNGDSSKIINNKKINVVKIK